MLVVATSREDALLKVPFSRTRHAQFIVNERNETVCLPAFGICGQRSGRSPRFQGADENPGPMCVAGPSGGQCVGRLREPDAFKVAGNFTRMKHTNIRAKVMELLSG